MPGLLDLLDDDHTGIAAIAAYLDGLDPPQRWQEVGRLDRDHQRTLYEKAAHAPPIDIAHFVGTAGPRQEVIHDGLNTLPVAARYKRFQRRFCRPEPAAADGNGHGVIDARLF